MQDSGFEVFVVLLSPTCSRGSLDPLQLRGAGQDRSLLARGQILSSAALVSSLTERKGDQTHGPSSLSPHHDR